MEQDEIYQKLQDLQDRSQRGRRPGTLTQKTLNLRNEIEQAFEEVGGLEYLKLIAVAKPDQFIQLLKLLIPHHINVQHEGRVEIIERVLVQPGEVPIGSSQVEHITLEGDYEQEIEDL